ncbi:MAG: stage V sporulation protein AC [Clostridia bacterium]|nr:stage V sporulation protein AC [Clostridia bacterium]
MPITNKEYDGMAKKASPPSPKLKNCLNAFFVGGLICTIGEALRTYYISLDWTQEEVMAGVAVVLIALTAILTATGVFDKIARYAGAGTIVPITGFANSVVSPAMEFQSEGRILGTGANMFKIAGPVIVYGCSTAVLYGLILWIFKLY